MSFVELQKGIYNKLTGDSALMALVKGVYDNPAQVTDPGDNAEFPFLTMSDIQPTPWDTDGDVGTDAQFTIHVWSRASHALEAREIQDAITSLLHRDKLVITGQRVIGLDYIRADVQRDADGLTRHGIQDFRITYIEV